MESRLRSTVVGVFRDRPDAERAVEDLERAGFTKEQIGFAVRGEGRTEGHVGGKDVKTEEGAAAGLLGGATLGGLAGALAAGLIPGIGPVIAGGILLGVLEGAAAGGAAGGLLGALVGMGVPEEEAHYYKQEFKSGRTIVTVKADGRHDQAASILRRHGADIEPARFVGDYTMGTGEQSRRLELRAEQLQARKEPVESGEVTVGKEVVTEHRIDVPVRREVVFNQQREVQEPRTVSDEVRREASWVEAEGRIHLRATERAIPDHEHHFVDNRCTICEFRRWSEL